MTWAWQGLKSAAVRGIHRSTNYKKLGVPGILETPGYEILIVEDPEPNGPYGAKGISEVAKVPITPAILNAIYDAVGVRITKLPATPDRVRVDKVRPE